MSQAAASPRQERRLLQQDLSRQHLLDAAEEIFGRKGFHETTLREIAELAEYSVGSVYTFFASKDELFEQIFVRRGEEFMPGLTAVLADEGADPLAQLHAVVDFEIGFFRQHPHFGRLYLRYSSAVLQSTDRAIDVVMRERYEEAMRLQRSLFERGQRTGAFRDGDAGVLARLLSGLVSAYQALDPDVVSDDGAGARLPLAELHDIVEAAFARR